MKLIREWHTWEFSVGGGRPSIQVTRLDVPYAPEPTYRAGFTLIGCNSPDAYSIGETDLKNLLKAIETVKSFDVGMEEESE